MHYLTADGLYYSGMALNDVINLVIALISTVISCGALWLTYKNLIEMRKQLQEQKEQFFDQNRGQAVFIFTKRHDIALARMTIRNCGNSALTINKIEMIPNIYYSDKLDAFKGVYMAPKQDIFTEFTYDKINHKQFNISLHYETCGKNYDMKTMINTEYYNLTGAVNSPDELITSELRKIRNCFETISGNFSSTAALIHKYVEHCTKAENVKHDKLSGELVELKQHLT